MNINYSAVVRNISIAFHTHQKSADSDRRSTFKLVYFIINYCSVDDACDLDAFPGHYHFDDSSDFGAGLFEGYSGDASVLAAFLAHYLFADACGFDAGLFAGYSVDASVLAEFLAHCLFADACGFDDFLDLDYADVASALDVALAPVLFDYS